MKNIFMPVMAVVVVLSCVLAINANVNSSKLNKTLNGERSKRIGAEEQLLKAQQQVASLQKELGDAKSKMASIEKILTDGKELANELEAMKKDRDLLKQQLEGLQAGAAFPVE